MNNDPNPLHTEPQTSIGSAPEPCLSEIIAVCNVFKHYDQGLVKALNGVSFSVVRGEFVAVMGPSGCGKSTLLNLIGTLDRPTAGEIRVEGKPIFSIKPMHRFRAESVGFVFQFHHLIPTLTLLENVELPVYSLSVSACTRRKKAMAILEEMGLSDRAGFLPTRVSGGERQRAAIARALVNNPKIILADEPTGSVDSETGTRILKILVRQCEVNRATLLLATHNHEIASDADRIIYLKNGRLQENETSGLYSTRTSTESNQVGARRSSGVLSTII